MNRFAAVDTDARANANVRNDAPPPPPPDTTVDAPLQLSEECDKCAWHCANAMGLCLAYFYTVCCREEEEGETQR